MSRPRITYVSADRSSTRSDKPRFVGDHDRLGPIAQIQLRQNSPDVGLRGLFRDEQCVADLGVGQSTGDQP